MNVNAGERAVQRCDRLGGGPYSEADGQLYRPFLSRAHRNAVDAVDRWMREAGLETRLDPIGNLVGRREAGPGAPTLIIGSHLDSVRDAGRYDGPLGVMIGVECAETLKGARLPFALEVIAFGDEEGSRFPTAMMCSRAQAGGIDPRWLDLTDTDGISVRQALADFGLEPEAALQPARAPGEVLAYVEAHIEQGPLLEAAVLPVGVVTGIACQLRLEARFSGAAGHAGTTPMHLRRDALAAAAEAIGVVEAICARGPRDLVGTVGRISASTSAFNVIAGAAEIGIDIRAASEGTRDAAAGAVRAEIEALAARRGVAVRIERLHALPPSPCDPGLIARMEAAVRAVGVEPLTLASGAGHDAMAMARLAPTAMLFIRCAGGVSHNPAEQVTAADADLACQALTAFVEGFAEDVP